MLTHCRFCSLLRLDCVERITDTVRAGIARSVHLISIPLLISLRSCGRCDKRRSQFGESNPQPEPQVQGDQLHVKFRQTANNFYLKYCILFFSSFDFESLNLAHPKLCRTTAQGHDGQPGATRACGLLFPWVTASLACVADTLGALPISHSSVYFCAHWLLAASQDPCLLV